MWQVRCQAWKEFPMFVLQTWWFLVVLETGSALAAGPPVARRDLYGDKLPAGAVARLGTVELSGRDVRPGQWLQNRPGFPIWPEALSYSRDGRSIYAASALDVTRWDAATGRRLGSVKIANRDRVPLNCFLFTADGEQLISAAGQFVEVHDCRTQRKRLLGTHSTDVRALALSADGRLLASADDNEVRLWDFPGGKLRWRANTTSFARIARGLAFSPNGRILALGENRARLHLLAVNTGKLIASLQQEGAKKLDALADYPDGEWAGIFSADGEMLFTSHRDTFRIWDVKNHRPVLTDKRTPLRLPRLVPKVPPTALVASPDHQLLARIDPHDGVYLYEAASGGLLHRFTDAIKPIAFAPSGWQLAAGNAEDHSILIWDLGALFRSLPPPRSGVQSAATLWADLAHRDPAVAHRALWRLAVLPGRADFLSRRLPLLPAEAFKRPLADLGSNDFTARQKAEREIAQAGAAAGPALEAALANTEDLELRKRLERLLRPLDPDGTDALRHRRAVLALEASPTPKARKLLERLAAGIPGARLTEEARRAIK
jgi:hypothetical protein